MEMKFQFDKDKAIQTMAYIVAKLNSVDKLKLMKLVYLADRTHFLSHGHPITGDRQCAMPYGPVPSETYNVLNGNIWPDPEAALKYLHIDDYVVMLRHDPGTGDLSSEEIQTLDEIIKQYGNMDTRRLVNLTHELPEYKEAFVKDTSRPIFYELILKHSGSEAHYRLNRPVVSSATLGHLLCPFKPNEDADL